MGIGRIRPIGLMGLVLAGALQSPGGDIPFPAALNDANVSMSALADPHREGLIVGNGDLYGIVWERDGVLAMRVTKNDILAFVANGKETATTVPSQVKETITETPVQISEPIASREETKLATHQVSRVQYSGADEVIEMTRMGKLIAKHMVDSVSTSAHVQSFIEVDVSNVVNWRAKMKDSFEKTEGEKLTFTPIQGTFQTIG